MSENQPTGPMPGPQEGMPTGESSGTPQQVSEAEVLAAAARIVDGAPDAVPPAGTAVGHPLEQAADAVSPANVAGGLMEDTARAIRGIQGPAQARLTAFRQDNAAARAAAFKSGAGSQFANTPLTKRLRARGGAFGSTSAQPPTSSEPSETPPA
jgi:hypothetical protein